MQRSMCAARPDTQYGPFRSELITKRAAPVTGDSVHILRNKPVDTSRRISMLRGGPSAPNGGRSSVRMGVQTDDTHCDAGHASGRSSILFGSDQETSGLESASTG